MVPTRLAVVASSSGQSGRSVATANRQALPVVAPGGGGATSSLLLLPPVMRWMAGLVAALATSSVYCRPCGPCWRRGRGMARPGRRQAVAAAAAARAGTSGRLPTGALRQAERIQLHVLCGGGVAWLALLGVRGKCSRPGVRPPQRPPLVYCDQMHRANRSIVAWRPCALRCMEVRMQSFSSTSSSPLQRNTSDTHRSIVGSRRSAPCLPPEAQPNALPQQT